MRAHRDMSGPQSNESGVVSRRNGLADGFCFLFLLRYRGDLEADALVARIRLVVGVLVLSNILRDAFREGAADVLVRAVAVEMLAGSAHRLDVLRHGGFQVFVRRNSNVV